MPTSYMPYNTRTHWTGVNADISAHLEIYNFLIDGSYMTNSQFRSTGWVNWKSLQDMSNVYRWDQVGAVGVKGRRSGDSLDIGRVVNEKAVLIVDTTSYVRTAFDWNDVWTSPDFQRYYSREHGIAHAKAFDRACVITLIKGAQYVAPQSLLDSGSFYNGVLTQVAGWQAATEEDRAIMLVQEHANQLNIAINRDQDISKFVTLVTPAAFTALLNHPKLINADFASVAPGRNDFSMRRVAYLNGTRVVETARFPTGAITDHHLGPDFNITADEAAVGMITFDPEVTLIGVEAHPMTTKVWDDDKEFNSVLDSYNMYNLGIRRGDSCYALQLM